MPKNLMPVIDICGNPLSEAQGHGSMLVAQEIRVFQCELEASLVGRHGKDRLSSICDPGIGVLEEDVAVVRDVAGLVRVGFALATLAVDEGHRGGVQGRGMFAE